MLVEKLSPKKPKFTMPDLPRIDGDAVFQFLILSLFGSFMVLMVAIANNHINSKIVESVIAECYDREYEPPYDTTEVHYNHDAKGNVTGSYVTVEHHPEEWHVYWVAKQLTYNQEVGYDYSGIKVGDHRPMNIREGYLWGDKYLWPN